MLAIAYARWSSLEQGKGSTLERQLQVVERYCTQHELEVLERVTDEGSSAYAGTNVQTGNLGKIVSRVESGQLPRDITIVVEQLDRISRLPPAQVIAWIQKVTTLGVTIATANDGYIINADTISTNLMGFMGLVFNSFRAHEESRHKSERLSASWKIKRDRLGKADIRPITGVCPAWLRMDANKAAFEIVPDRAAIVHEIFQRTSEGEGKRAITSDLNRRNVEPWGRGKSKASAWHPSYVQKILQNPAVIGEFQPHTKPRGSARRVPIGDPISGYYPAVVSETLWATVRAQRPAVPGNDGQRGQVRNLLSGLCRCGRCGGPMAFQLKSHEGTRMRKGVAHPQRQASYLSCALRVRGGPTEALAAIKHKIARGETHLSSRSGRPVKGLGNPRAEGALGRYAGDLTLARRARARRTATRYRELAPVVAAIMAAGYTKPSAVAAELNRQGIATVRGAKWHASTAARLIAARVARASAMRLGAKG